MFVDNIYDFFKKINFRRFLPVLACSLLFVALSPLQAFAFSSQPGTLDNSWILHNTDYSWDLYVYGYPSEFSIQSTPYTEEDKGTSTLYRFDISNEINNLSSVFWFSVYNKSARFDFEYLPLIYDYYFLVQLSSSSTELNTNPFTFFPDEVLVNFSNFGEDDSIPPEELNSVSVPADEFKVSLSDTMGFSVVGKFPEPVSGSTSSNSFFSPVGFEFRNSTPNLLLSPRVNFEGLIVAIPKNADTSSVLAILQQIYTELLEQGTTLDTIFSLLDDLFYYIFNVGIIDDGSGNLSSIFGQPTLDILGGLIDKNPELDSYVQQYTQVEQSMYDKFTENQSAVVSDFSGWSWGSLSTAVDWTSDYLNRIYDNSGDFRTMFMYPILAGIALIFIGRQGLSAYSRSKKRGD